MATDSPVTSAPAPADQTPERTIGQLVADATHDVSSIVRNEIALAKIEVANGAKSIGTGAGLFAAAGFVALLGLISLFHAAAWGIGEFLPVWAGYLIVGGLLFLIAAILGLVGRSAIRKANPTPERAIRNAQETLDALTPGH